MSRRPDPRKGFRSFNWFPAVLETCLVRTSFVSRLAQLVLLPDASNCSERKLLHIWDHRCAGITYIQDRDSSRSRLGLPHIPCSDKPLTTPYLSHFDNPLPKGQLQLQPHVPLLL